jgi:hypothetical protein
MQIGQRKPDRYTIGMAVHFPLYIMVLGKMSQGCPNNLTFSDSRGSSISLSLLMGQSASAQTRPRARLWRVDEDALRRRAVPEPRFFSRFLLWHRGKRPDRIKLQKFDTKMLF